MTLAEEYQSGPDQSVMVELYTSEGCSSCPPAEQYLNSYIGTAQLWKTHFPMAFHVDYWDYLGWKDRFSDSAHSTRQRVYARHLKQRTLFTPAFFVNGQPWRPGWFNDKYPPVSSKPGGLLTINVEKQALEVDYQPTKKLNHQELVLHVVVLGLGLTTNIEAGENKGRMARHDFVVLEHDRYPGKDAKWRVTLPKFNKYDARELALVAWVSVVGDPTPLQVAGGPWHPSKDK